MNVSKIPIYPSVLVTFFSELVVKQSNHNNFLLKTTKSISMKQPKKFERTKKLIHLEGKDLGFLCVFLLFALNFVYSIAEIESEF
jgi:hypothetical protein